MNRIDQLFSEKKKRVLSIYMTAGYPHLDDTAGIVSSLQEGGADMVEIGMPFSDPLADGPVIQHSSQVAIGNGMTCRLLFDQLKDIRKTIRIPLLLMGYLNPVLKFGVKSFVDHCVKTGIDGLIIPDLPLEVYKKEFKKYVDEAGLKFVMLITPQTTEERINLLSRSSGAAGGFLYMVADSSTTGAMRDITPEQITYFRRIEEMNLPLPRLIGFGISDAVNFNRAASFANGAIIGSAFIRALGENPGDPEKVSLDFVRSILSPGIG